MRKSASARCVPAAGRDGRPSPWRNTAITRPARGSERARLRDASCVGRRRGTRVGVLCRPRHATPTSADRVKRRALRPRCARPGAPARRRGRGRRRGDTNGGDGCAATRPCPVRAQGGWARRLESSFRLRRRCRWARSRRCRCPPGRPRRANAEAAIPRRQAGRGSAEPRSRRVLPRGSERPTGPNVGHARRGQPSPQALRPRAGQLRCGPRRRSERQCRRFPRVGAGAAQTPVALALGEASGHED